MAHKEQLQREALSRATSGQSFANFQPIFEGLVGQERILSPQGGRPRAIAMLFSTNLTPQPAASQSTPCGRDPHNNRDSS